MTIQYLIAKDGEVIKYNDFDGRQKVSLELLHKESLENRRDMLTEELESATSDAELLAWAKENFTGQSGYSKEELQIQLDGVNADLGAMK
jgi:hypothetical protein